MPTFAIRVVMSGTIGAVLSCVVTATTAMAAPVTVRLHCSGNVARFIPGVKVAVFSVSRFASCLVYGTVYGMIRNAVARSSIIACTNVAGSVSTRRITVSRSISAVRAGFSFVKDAIFRRSTFMTAFAVNIVRSAIRTSLKSMIAAIATNTAAIIQVALIKVNKGRHSSFWVASGASGLIDCAVDCMRTQNIASLTTALFSFGKAKKSKGNRKEGEGGHTVLV
mmetsp:Transcript_22797/g.36817  ORF Transcript_22797/g.36817 Transcript_22797/m.36817 type:complete len:223 (-) Transcript_22797:82-750(-)